MIEGYITRGLKVLTPHLLKAFLNGIPIGKLGQITEALVGISISPTTASNMVKALNEEIARWHSRVISDDYKYLLFDVIHLKRRSPCSFSHECCGKSKRVVLVAYGIKSAGTRKLLEFRLVDKECKEHWTLFMMHLRIRGINEANLKHITTDKHKGIFKALATVCPAIPHQICWFHKSSHVLKKVRKKDRGSFAKDLVKIYKSSTLSQAMKSSMEFHRKWNDEYPRSVRSLEPVLYHFLNIFSIPPPDRKAARTKNVIESAFREVRKRTRPIVCFVNDMSISRVILATFSHYDSKEKKLHKPLKPKAKVA